MRSLIQALAELHYPKESITHQLLSLFHPMNVLGTQTVLRAGEVPKRLLLISEGLGHMYFRRKVNNGASQKRTQNITRLVASPGEWLTVPDAFIDQTRSDEQIDLMGGSKIFYLYHNDFKNLCETDEIFRRASHRLWTGMVRKGFKREDVLKILHPLESRLDLLLGAYPNLEGDLPNRKALASLVGVSESTVKRYLAKRKA